MRVLIIEDDPTLTAVLARWLLGAGHEVRIGDTAHWEQWAEIDLALVDLHGDVKGWVAVEMLRDLGVKVVVMTGANGEEMRERAARLGVVAWLTKPFELDELRAVLA